MRCHAIGRILGILICCFVSSSSLSAQNPVPFVNQPLIPAAAAPGGAAFTLTISGTGFVSGATVQWNGSARATTFVSSTQLTAAILSADIAAAQTARITVVNPTPGGGASNIVFFPVTDPTKSVAFSSSAVTMAAPSFSIVTVNGTPITADLNGDGKADLVVLSSTNSNGVINVRLGNGDGTFQPIVQYAYNAPGNPSAEGIAVGDFNGDGIPDIAVTSPNAITAGVVNTTAVLLGNGDGTFRSPVTSTQSLPGQTVLADPHAVDVNKDGKLDLVGICGYGVGPGSICVLLGNGDGTFTAGYSSQPLARAYRGVQALAIGDFNGDGNLDVVASVDPSYLVLLFGLGDGTFGPYSIIFTSNARFTGGVVAADFNGDGKLDLAYYHDECAYQDRTACAGNLDFLLGNGDGTFQPPMTLRSLSEPQTQQQPIVADFNGDGQIDLAFGDNLLLLGTWTGNGAPSSYSLLSIPTNSSELNAAGDFNGDGKLDLVQFQAPTGGQATISDLNLFLQTASPDFTWSSSSPYQTVVSGATASYTITISAVDGFNGTLQFSVTGLPAGTTPTFTPNTVTGSGSTTLSITTSASTPTGSYPIVVTASSGTLSKSGGLTLNVGPAGSDFTDFAGWITPTTYQTVTPGGVAGYGITIQALNGFTGNVALSASGLPAGTNASFNPATINGGSGTSTLTVTTAASTPTGSYPFTLTATSGSHTHSTTLYLDVGPAGSNFGDFSGTMTPTSQTVKVGNNTSVTISLQPNRGYVGSAYLTLDPLPSGSGIGASGNQTIPVPGSTTVTITTSTTTPPGNYAFVFRVQGGNSFGVFEHSGTFTLTVTP